MDHQLATTPLPSTSDLHKFWIGLVIVFCVGLMLAAYAGIAWTIHQFAGSIGVSIFAGVLAFAVCFIIAARKFGQARRDK